MLVGLMAGWQTVRQNTGSAERNNRIFGLFVSSDDIQML